MTIKTILAELHALQNSLPTYFPNGIFPSYRYHPLLKFYRRADDNVYFTAFAVQSLNKVLPQLEEADKIIASKIIESGESGIQNYKNRFGDVTYNFYRPDGFFPNGTFLSKFKRFQPTDDADDTAIAYRAIEHSLADAKEVKDHLRRLSNCKRDRFSKRGPRLYRKIQAYNTWIGTDGLYVDLDFCVITNALIFNAKYDLGITKEDLGSLKYLKSSITNGDYLNKKWGINAWYPFDSVILYQVSELIQQDYYDIDLSTIVKLQNDMLHSYSKCKNLFDKVLLDIALWRLKTNHNSEFSESDINESFINATTKTFSYGVIPLLHPFDGQIFQKIGNNKIFQLRYECRAQILCILMEWKIMKALN